jgi:RsiW-degrading membrane proteinase PrsW (M82 family)
MKTIVSFIAYFLLLCALASAPQEYAYYKSLSSDQIYWSWMLVLVIVGMVFGFCSYSFFSPKK